MAGAISALTATLTRIGDPVQGELETTALALRAIMHVAEIANASTTRIPVRAPRVRPRRPTPDPRGDTWLTISDLEWPIGGFVRICRFTLYARQPAPLAGELRRSWLRSARPTRCACGIANGADRGSQLPARA